MKISTKGRYGSRAALELALRYGEGPVMVREIAESQNISERYLEQILNTLRTTQIVKSTRGAKGGYELAKPPAEITISDIIHALEGPFDVVPCTAKMDCDRELKCVTTFVWHEVKNALESVLTSFTLADLVTRYHEHVKTSEIEFSI